MEKPYILHLFTPMAQASPFDINMAYDAGYDGVVPYTHVELEQVAALTQDTIFSRGPKGAKRTGIFIGGRDNGLAADMLDVARKAMVPPFEVSVFVDPSGAFTTAAAMVAAVEKHLKKAHATDLNGKTVMIFGGSGPVGAAATASYPALIDMLMPPSPMKRRRRPCNGVPDFVTWPLTRISRLRNSRDVVSPSRTSTCFDIMLIIRPRPALAIRFT